MNRFIPVRHRPNFDEEKISFAIDNRDFFLVTHWEFWKKAAVCANRNCVSLLEASKMMFEKKPIPDPPEPTHPTYRSEVRVCIYMMQFEGWQTKSYDLEKLREKDWTTSRLLPPNPGRTLSAEDLLDALSPGNRAGELVTDLWANKRKNELKDLLSHPIFKFEAEFELKNIEWDENHEAAEKARIAALPKKIRKIDLILRKLGPSNYNVNYPWPPNSFHNIPNCLIVSADGSTLFRLEVMDPGTENQFCLRFMQDPWWGLYARIMEPPAPGEGEYDFPFYDFNIKEDDVFDYQTLLKVIRKGASQIKTRSQRKYGRTS